MAKFDFIKALQHEVAVLNRASSLRMLEDEEYLLLSDFECYTLGILSFSDLKSKYFNRYRNVR